jgi:hypothetical protein
LQGRTYSHVRSISNPCYRLRMYLCGLVFAIWRTAILIVSSQLAVPPSLVLWIMHRMKWTYLQNLVLFEKYLAEIMWSLLHCKGTWGLLLAPSVHNEIYRKFIFLRHLMCLILTFALVLVQPSRFVAAAQDLYFMEDISLTHSVCSIFRDYTVPNPTVAQSIINNQLLFYYMHFTLHISNFIWPS